uniref:Uncharacterized protein n=1 Tax=Lactuca sativa TaxID=4236 RepID=A0A9R1VRI0_LACSA|nr:hypothetical protein LSAT_V11C400200510 [Lactuca sativa]
MYVSFSYCSRLQKEWIRLTHLTIAKLHDNLGQKANLTLKGVVGTIIKDYFTRLTKLKRALFEASPFEKLLGMHVPNGDPLLVRLMMLHEVWS